MKGNKNFSFLNNPKIIRSILTKHSVQAEILGESQCFQLLKPKNFSFFNKTSKITLVLT